MSELRRTGLGEAFREAVRQGKPCLGVCLGLQLLFESSTEDGEHIGLGLLPGRVVRFTAQPGLKVPHMGWNTLRIRKPAPLLAGLPAEPSVYFVHSYYALPQNPDDVAAEADYPESVRGRRVARQPDGLPVPSRKEPGDRAGHVCQLRGNVIYHDDLIMTFPDPPVLLLKTRAAARPLETRPAVAGLDEVAAVDRAQSNRGSSPGLAVDRSEPRCRRQMAWAIVSPMPVWSRLVLKKGSVACLRTSGLIPRPVSPISMMVQPLVSMWVGDGQGARMPRPWLHGILNQMTEHRSKPAGVTSDRGIGLRLRTRSMSERVGDRCGFDRFANQSIEVDGSGLGAAAVVLNDAQMPSPIDQLTSNLRCVECRFDD